MNYLQALEKQSMDAELSRRLEVLAGAIVDEARSKFTDDVVVELLARGIIQVTRIQVEKAKILKDESK